MYRYGSADAIKILKDKNVVDVFFDIDKNMDYPEFDIKDAKWNNIDVSNTEYSIIWNLAKKVCLIKYIECDECGGSGEKEVSDCHAMSASNCCGGCTKKVRCNECIDGEVINEFYNDDLKDYFDKLDEEIDSDCAVYVEDRCLVYHNEIDE